MSYLTVFLIFLIILFPFAKGTVAKVVQQNLSIRTKQVIALVSTADSEKGMVKKLEESGPRFFFRVTLLTPDGTTLYESHKQASAQEQDKEQYLLDHPEVTDALRSGTGYYEGFSYSLRQPLVYFARTFTFQGQEYVMRTAFPVSEVRELTDRFEIGFMTLGVALLLLFGVMSAAIVHHISRPIQRIIAAIKPYQEGTQENLPEITLGKSKKKDEFQQLADTLNSLSQRVKQHITRLRNERNERDLILDALGEGVIALDASLRVLYSNKRAQGMLSLHPRELLAQPLSSVGHHEFHELVADCVEQREVLAINTMIADGKRLYLDVIATPTEEGALLVLQDKSIHYRFLQMRKEFIANASHELKTPITIIQGYAETLLEHPDMSVDLIREITEKMVRNCERMDSLVRNFLRLADIEDLPRASLKKTLLKELVERCRTYTLSVYPEAQIEIIEGAEGPITVMADPELLELAVGNLISNAAKYCKEKPRILVKLSMTPTGDHALIVVEDNGIGIPVEDQGRIFDRFYTVDKAHSRRLGGSGLGLSIVRTIVEKHFGKVWVQSVLGEGSVFTIQIPVNLGEEPGHLVE